MTARPAPPLVRFSTADLLQAHAMGIAPIAWHDAGRPKVQVVSVAVKPPKSVKPWAPYRSKWEWDYAKRLELERAAGLIRDWSYETERVQIGLGASYKPDFPVTMADGSRQMREVKGYKREAAMVRIKAAALRYPEFLFVLVTRKGGTWKLTPVGKP